MALYQKTKRAQELETIAKRAPLSYILPSGYDPSSYIMPIPTMVKAGVQKKLLSPLFGKEAVRSPEVRHEIADALRVLGKVPKNVYRKVKGFGFGNPIGENLSYGGQFDPPTSRIDVWGKGIIASAGKPRRSLASALGHETGHEASRRIWERLTKEDIRNWKFRQQLEGVSEYLGSKVREAAGVPSEMIISYGPGQEEAIKTLFEMPSKNPYMNVYRYLKQILGD